jgi:protein TonB
LRSISSETPDTQNLAPSDYQGTSVPYAKGPPSIFITMIQRFRLSHLTFLLLPLLAAATVRAQDDVLTKVDEAPVATKMLPPEYPDSLKAAKVSGLVAVSAVIDETGNVVTCEVLKATNDDFRQPALDAAKNWKFKPAKNAGKAVKVRVTLPVRFSPPA